MTRWFRFYAEALNDPKVQRLDGDTFKFWVNILCIASENDGVLPAPKDAAFALRLDENGAVTVFERLHNAGLIDKANGGKDGWHYAPHGWAKRQYKSDSSTSRVKRFRKRSEVVSETPPETEADTEQSTLPKGSDGEPSAGKMVWDDALSFYGPSKRSMIGMWVKKHTAERFMEVMIECQRADPFDRIAWTEGAFKARAKPRMSVPI